MTWLRFLDAKPVNLNEKLLALQTLSELNGHDEHQSSVETSPTRMFEFSSLKNYFGFLSRGDPSSGLDKRRIYSPLPPDTMETMKSPKSAYGKVKTNYEGSQSQGNRFILNQDL